MNRKTIRRALRNKLLGASLIFAILYSILTYRAYGFISPLVVLKGFVKLFLGGEIPAGVWAFFLDVSLFMFVFAIWIAYYAQFTLPVRNFGQRLLSAGYLLRYPWKHGPAVLIQKGEIPDRYEKDRPHPPGVILLDTDSAAVLRKRSHFTRSVGPGLVFTAQGEYLAGAVDLHQRASNKPALGPLKAETDPFAPWDEEHETRDQFEQRQANRFATKGETRDGVEVVPFIYTVSRLNEQPMPDRSGDTGAPAFRGGILGPYMDSDTLSRYGYHPESVRRAITGEAVDPLVQKPFADKKPIPWYELSGYLAVNLWREYLHCFTFDELFIELKEYGGDTAFQVIQKKVFERLTKPDVLYIDEVGKPTTNRIPSPEYRLLEQRGIRVTEAHIRNLHFEKAIEQQIEDKWVSYWQIQARSEREYLKRLGSYKEHAGEKDALREFALYSTRKFDPKFLANSKPSPRSRPYHLRETVERLLRGTLMQLVQNPEVHQNLAGEESEIVDIINWLRSL